LYQKLDEDLLVRQILEKHRYTANTCDNQFYIYYVLEGVYIALYHSQVVIWAKTINVGKVITYDPRTKFALALYKSAQEKQKVKKMKKEIKNNNIE